MGSFADSLSGTNIAKPVQVVIITSWIDIEENVSVKETELMIGVGCFGQPRNPVPIKVRFN